MVAKVQKPVQNSCASKVHFISLHCILLITLPNLCIPDVLFSTLLSALMRRRFQVQPATLLIPINLFHLLSVEEIYGTRYHSGSFSSLNVRSGFSQPA